MPGMDDLSQLFLPTSFGVKRHSTGKILSWNPGTFENVVAWNGSEVTNMAIGNPVDALSYSDNMWVSIEVIDSSGAEGVSQAVISGRIIQPGEAAAEEAISFLRGNLAREISAEVFASQIHSAFDQAAAQRNSTTFGDPTNGALPGPSLTGIDIRIGTALVMISCNIAVSTEDTTAANTGEYGGILSVEVSGATSISPDTHRGVLAQKWKYNNGGAITTVDGITGSMTGTIVYPITGLTPGLHNFTLKYRKSDTSSSGILCDDRSLTVIAF